MICASLGGAVNPGPDGTGPVVAYEADYLDAARRSGWSVVVVGRAAVVADDMLAARYRESLGPSWPDEQASQVITITAELVTGHLMNPGVAEAVAGGGPPTLAR